MGIGAKVRGLLGPLERPVSALYRRAFVDLDAFMGTVAGWTGATRILEVGCGEGAVTERLAAAYPQAQIVAIDITPRVGRMFSGDTARVTFRNATVQAVVAESPGVFDLVILADVIHHVPQSLRREILDSVRAALAPGGRFVFKDWVKNRTPIHLACLVSDRYITGDDVHYFDEDGLRVLTEQVFGRHAIRAEARVAPWANNLAFLVEPTVRP